MQIKELEQMTGMTRANIRYYEQEGLLHPARGENGYRDYGKQDVEALQRIKLLRELHVSIEEIRAMQAGREPLGEVMRRQAARLSGEAADREAARAVCERILADGVEYDTLSPERYRTAIPPEQRWESGYFSIEEDALPGVPNPWRRYFARVLDFELYGLLPFAVGRLLLRVNPEPNLFLQIVASYLAMGLMLLLEPILLALFGTTPGKAVFGLCVRDAQGKKPGYRAALRRTWEVFAQGMGYGVPVYGQVRMYKGYRACKRGEPLPWEEELRYTIKDTRALRLLGFCGGYALIVLAMALVLLQARMPIRRAPLTPEAYVENWMDQVAYNRLHMPYALDAAGHSTAPAPDPNTAIITVFPDLARLEHTLLLEDGVVTGVRIVMEADGSGEGELLSINEADCRLAAMSFLAAQPGMHCFSLLGEESFLARMQGLAYDFTVGGVRVARQSAYTGYEEYADMGILWPQEGAQAHSYRSEFTLTLAQSPAHCEAAMKLP